MEIGKVLRLGSGFVVGLGLGLGLVLILVLLFMALPMASAHIEIIDMDTGYDKVVHYGYVSYRNTADYNLSGAILVFIDGDIVAGRMLDLGIQNVSGSQQHSMLFFALNETEGSHTIVAHVVSMNSSVERSYEYVMEPIGDTRGEPVPGSDIPSYPIDKDGNEIPGVADMGYGNITGISYGIFQNGHHMEVIIVVVESSGKTYTFVVSESDYMNEKKRPEMFECWGKR